VVTHVSSEQRLWLISPRIDFWLACGGASIGLLVSIVVIFLHGDRELDALDFVLSEFHLGATYYVVLRRQLWRHRQVDVLVVPLLILASTFVLSMWSQTTLLTSIAMYAAVWHRGRQSLGVARFYQRQVGGPLSQMHDRLFRGAIYLPMLAALFAYTHFAPLEYEGEPYLAVTVGARMTCLIGVAAGLWVGTYIVWTQWQRRCAVVMRLGAAELRIHPGEWWVVVANAVAFGSGYALGASNASFLLVLAVHHEVQYLYFAYANTRAAASSHGLSNTEADPPKTAGFDASHTWRRELSGEVKHAACFLVWPLLGFAGAVAGGWLESEWLAPLGIGGLFCHYWLDGRIWTRRSLDA
jgi:hypothetical protein